MKTKKNIILAALAGVLLLVAVYLVLFSGGSAPVEGSADVINQLKEETKDIAPPPEATPPGGRRLKGQ